MGQLGVQPAVHSQQNTNINNVKKDGERERERDKAKYIMEEDGEEKSDSVEIKSTISITNFAKRNRKRGKEKVDII